ncbi:type III secretion apparatus InvA [Sodalis glossinidius str. 'morsitans']|uniref:Type III secretion apparatus InvA n=1 Tax=Sodalis glossinidius (strain morsitans) TaxID=343509 RepID=Q2NR60_SODGM|nr:EscV/YscV/HrcV family type III secretion system export apparatus protein [Sodalis glossinidius]BAE75365.1 type III secretion apparatus InvA [Sodalis glossinidius str. 'morsitans']
MLNRFLNHIYYRPELLILVLVITIIFMIIIPLPAYLVDFLIGLNIVIAMLVFIGAFYIDRILSFSTFPAVLLITTLFRLALTISTSRLILTDADAGEIIATFGQFVIGDNLVVGFVIFAIVTVVQFIVITKGSERVAEVAARFCLDGMPGKQMSIDADLRGGVIDAEGARQRRSVLERESQLYGAFDGAMKFIKGDAIASIIVAFVNFIGGIAVGMNQHHMDLSQALSTFTLLTIGDGLVGQIPALLISISAGLIVTRVNGDGDNLGRNIMQQLLGNPFVLLVTAVLALSIGMLPGFPLPVFVMLAMALGTLLLMRQRQTRVVPLPAAADYAGGYPERIMPEALAVILQVSRANYARLEKEQLCERLRGQFLIDFGVALPPLMLCPCEHTDDRTVVVVLNEIRADVFTLHFDMLRRVIPGDRPCPPDVTLHQEQEAVWAALDDRERLLATGCVLRPAVDELYHCFAVMLTHHVNEFFGVQETKHLLDQMESHAPDLLKEVLRHATVQRIAELLQRLLMERISIRHLKLIMEAMALWAPREKDVSALVEHVRCALARYICHQFAADNLLRVIMLSSEVEETLRDSLHTTSAGTFLNLGPQVSEELMELFTSALESLPIAQRDIVLLAAADIRRFIKSLIQHRFRDLEVLSFGELTESVTVNVIKTI